MTPRAHTVLQRTCPKTASAAHRTPDSHRTRHAPHIHRLSLVCRASHLQIDEAFVEYFDATLLKNGAVVDSIAEIGTSSSHAKQIDAARQAIDWD